MYCFKRIDIDNIDINEYYGFETKSIYTTLPWIEFLKDLTNGDACIIRITEDDKLIGYFTGIICKKYFIKVFGSPLPGWSTCYMGFDLYDNNLIPDIIQPLINYIFKVLKCHYFECTEKHVTVDKLINLKAEVSSIKCLEVDMSKGMDAVFTNVKGNVRQFIRQFEKKGATIEIVEPDDNFAEELYEHIVNVFKKQNLKPTYTMEKIKKLILHLKDTENILCLRVRNPEGKSIATYISIGYNKTCIGWCIGSLKEFQFYRPNEYLIWYAMNFWYGKGKMTDFDFAGDRHYKYKWNPVISDYSRIVASKFPILILIRKHARKFYEFFRHLNGA